MKIRKLQLKNIGVFDDETIEFQPCPARDKAEIHIFTGENGSGKSTILMALASIFNYWHGEGRLDKKEPFSFIEPVDMKNEISFTKRFRYLEELDINSIGVEVGFNDQSVAKLLVKSYFDDFPQTEFVGNNNELNDYRINVVSRYSKSINYLVLTYSGYRRINDESVELFKHHFKNPLNFTLNFDDIKDEEETFTINQWIANNISNRALAKEENDDEDIKKYTYLINSFEEIISEIIGKKVKFLLKRYPFSIRIKTDNEEFDFDVLPDGLRSLLSWVGDTLMRIDMLKWQDDLPIFEKNLILFLDEIEVHLHPAWQRKVLPVVQKLFKNAQIFVSTHSPFVVNSVDDAWVYKLELEDGKAKVAEVVKSEDGISYQTVLREIFGIDEEFGGTTQEDLNKFYKIVRNGKTINEKDLKKLAKSLAEQSEELNTIVQIELRQLSRRKGKEISL